MIPSVCMFVWIFIVILIHLFEFLGIVCVILSFMLVLTYGDCG